MEYHDFECKEQKLLGNLMLLKFLIHITTYYWLSCGICGLGV